MSDSGTLQRLRARGEAVARRGSEGLSDVCSRWVFRACDAALTAAPEHGGRPLLGGTHRSNYEHMQSLVARASRLFPSTVSRVRSRLSRLDLLPLAATDVELLSFGTASTVFLLRRGGPSDDGRRFVLKTFRKSIGRRTEPMLRHVAQLRARYETISGWYAESSVVVPTWFLILHGPVLGRSVVACLQPYIAGEAGDLFALAADGRLPRQLREHPSLRRQFQRFAKRTLEIADARQCCVDIMGSNNLLVAGSPGVPGLHLIDFGVHDFEELRTKSPERLAFARDRLLLLRRLHTQLLYEFPTDAPPSAEEV